MKESTETTPLDASDLPDPIKLELRASLKRERSLYRKIENLLDTSRREHAVHIQQTGDAMAKLIEENQLSLRALEATINDQAHAYRQLQHDSLQRQHALESEIWRTKLKWRYEVDDLLREMATRWRDQASGSAQTARDDLTTPPIPPMPDEPPSPAGIEPFAANTSTPLVVDTQCVLNDRRLNAMSSVSNRNTVPTQPKTSMTPPNSESQVSENASPPTEQVLPTMRPAESLSDLLSRDGAAFITSAYLTLLKRAPDADGYEHYYNRLCRTGDKLGILLNLYRSVEAGRVSCSLPGLKATMVRQRIARLPGFRLLSRLFRLSPSASEIALRFDALSARLSDMQQDSLRQLNQLVQISDRLDHFDGTAPGNRRSDGASRRYAFDQAWYLKAYPDVSTSGIDPFEHYMRFGKADQRFCCQAELVDSILDVEAYKRANPDVAAANLDPLQHYIELGRKEGRVGTRLRLTLFDPEWYLKYNPDVATAGADPLVHYITEGLVHHRPWTSFKQLSAIEPDALVYSEAPKAPNVKLIAFYLPQFHPIPENDKWWGKGFTEWTNVSRATPFYEEHDQPKLPGELGFYDLRLIDVMKRQVDLARVHGVFGFCFYLYWFGGHRLLETPVDLLLLHPEIDINFCYCWANENWTRRWDGLENDVLIGQSHSAEDDIAFIEHVSAAFSDPRYIRVDGKPILAIYRPSQFPDMRATASRWRDWCSRNGIGEIHLCSTESFGGGDPRRMGMDASIEFPPASLAVQEITPQMNMVDPAFKGQVHNYMFSAKQAKNYVRPAWTQYRGVMPAWDNTARKMERGISFFGATPELYAEWLDEAVTETEKSLPESGRLVFINAWNEWGEGAYLEPDRRRGYAYLNQTRGVMARHSVQVTHETLLQQRTRKSHGVAVIVHLYYGDLFEDIADYLDNLTAGADLYFSVRDGTFPKMLPLIADRYPDAVVVSYPNCGRDVLPFLRLLAHIQGFGYQAICKVHSKKSRHRQDGDQWRDDVFNKLLGGKEAIDECLGAILSGAGIVAPAGHLLDGSNYWGSNAKRVTELALKMACPIEWTEAFVFPAGTMFWFTPKALEPLMALALQPADFEVERGQVDGTTAHAVERLIGLSAMKSGLKIVESDGGVAVPREAEYPFAVRT